MKPIVAAYVVHGELKNVSPEQALALDVINVAFAHCVNSQISFEHTEDLEYLPVIRSYNPNIKILFSVGGWGSGGFSPMASTDQSRKSFACSCLDFVLEYGLDGIDIDWEYPCLDWAQIEASPDDKVNFTLMLEEIRNTFDRSPRPDLMLTIAVGNDSYFIKNTEMNKVAKLLDYVSVMTYDMRGCSDTLTGHHTNVYSYSAPDPRRGIRSVQHSVEIYANAGVPLNKLVIGAAFYSRMWKNVKCEDPSLHGLNCPADPGNYGPGYGELYRDYIDKNGFVSYYDKEAGGAYLFDGSTFISYDNERSLAEKCDFVKKNSLLGVMYWEHSCDNTGMLLEALGESAKETSIVNEYTVDKKLVASWAKGIRFKGINLILAIFWMIVAFTCAFMTVLSFAVKADALTTYIFILAFALSIYKLFFERKLRVNRQFKFYARMYGSTEWKRLIVFNDDSITVEECGNRSLFKYSDIDMITEKDNVITVFFKPRIFLRIYKDSFICGDCDLFKSLIRQKKPNIRFK